MNLVVENVYLGCFNSAENTELLKTNKIKYIFNVAFECNNSKNVTNCIKVCKYNFEDDRDISPSHLEEIYSKMINILPNDGNILVHCARGRSRSATIVLYYLMKKYNISLINAFDFLKDKRPIVNPCLDYIRLLAKSDQNFDINSYVVRWLMQNVPGNYNYNTDYYFNLLNKNNNDIDKTINHIYYQSNNP
jgi:protein-tyrosine phosphatase